MTIGQLKTPRHPEERTSSDRPGVRNECTEKIIFIRYDPSPIGDSDELAMQIQR